MWQNSITAFRRVLLGEVFPGIEVELNACGNNVEKRFLLKPGACPQAIRIEFEGDDRLCISDNGQLDVRVHDQTVSFTKPIAFQEIDGQRVFVDVAYSVNGDSYGFTVGEYDPTVELTIDPLLASTYIGGTGKDDDYEPSILVDDDGNVYLSGFTYSANFPTTTGVYDETFNGGTRDRFISKFDADLNTLLASTFIGGSGSEWGMGMALDGDGNVVIAGYTTSADFPMMPNSYDNSHNGGRDVYVAKLDKDLTNLLGSTYLGGSGNEGQTWPRIDLAISEGGNVFVAGLTRSTDFPASAGAYDDSFNGGSGGGDPFIARFDKGLTSLEAATYLGGNQDEWRLSLTVRGNDYVYLCGETSSTNYPTTPGAYDQTFNGGTDVFISKLPVDLDALTASTVLGKGSMEEALAMRLKDSGEVYIAGYTKSSGFPTTVGAYDRTFNGGDRDGYIARFDGDLTSLQASTFLGGIGRDDCRDMVLGKNGDVFLTGNTSSANFPTGNGCFDSSFNGGTPHGDVMAARLDGDLTKLVTATFLGGTSDDAGFCLTLGSDRQVYIGGYTSSTNFPMTENAYDPTYNGGINDCFIAKLDGLLSGSELNPDKYRLSETGDTIQFLLDVGSDKANRKYLMLGSVSGIEPGFSLPGGQALLPLNWDFCTDLFLSLANSPVFPGFMGTMDGAGQSTAQLFWPGPSMPPGSVGLALYFAFCLGWPWEFASNPVEIEIVP